MTTPEFRTVYHDCSGSTHWQFDKVLIPDDENEVARLGNNSDTVLNKLSNDPRITRVGKVLRKTSLDELPQLWNVPKEEMSLLGRRPPTVHVEKPLTCASVDKQDEDRTGKRPPGKVCVPGSMGPAPQGANR